MSSRGVLAAGALALGLALAGAAAGQSSPLTVEGSTAVLKGLDKITGRTVEIDARVGRAIKFGTLEITARSCRRSPPEERPETAVYLEITDNPVRGVDEASAPEPRRVFGGWMFASNPAANALEHPVYDVWAITCKA